MKKHLTLVLTEKCNARCQHCFEQDSSLMNQRRNMSQIDALEYISSMHDYAKKNNSAFAVSFTGGEPFLRYNNLLELVIHSRRRGASEISCMTNGYWGSNRKEASKKARTLADAGLRHIGVSLDDFHQEFIPKEHVLNVIDACLKNGISYMIKSVVTRKTRRMHQILGDVGDRLINSTVSIQEIPYIPTSEANKAYLADACIYCENVPEQACGSKDMLTILPDGSAYPCCSVGWNDAIKYGNAQTDNIDTLFKRMDQDIFLEILLKDGPVFFVPFLVKRDASFSQRRFVNYCHLCEAITSHSEFTNILHVAANAWRKRRVNKMMKGMYSHP